MIDNGKQGANWTYEAHGTIFTSAAPQAAAAISAIRRYADTRLRGKYKLNASSRDMEAAYKQIPNGCKSRVNDRDHCVRPNPGALEVRHIACLIIRSQWRGSSIQPYPKPSLLPSQGGGWELYVTLSLMTSE